MKKVLSIILSVAIAVTTCFAFGTFTFADTYNDESDIEYALYQNKYDSSNHITVNVAKGTYYLYSRLVIFPNTTFNCEGATFIKKYDGSTMLAIGQNQDRPTGNDYYENITINGGTFDANKKTGSIFSFAHSKDVTINGSTFKNCSNGHHLTFAGCTNVNVTGCTFEGSVNTTGDNMEALQLDILEPSHFPNYQGSSSPYDGTMNTDINITENIFKNVNRGVGAHSVFSGKYMSGINISNNTFENVAGYAVLATAFIKSKINGNTIKNCGSGIYYKTINPKRDEPQRPNTYKCNGKSYAPKIDSSTEICNNKISVIDTKDKTSKQWPYGIRLYGETLKKNEKVALAGDYSAQNITVSNNSVTVGRDATAIWLDGAKKCKINKNTVTFNKPKYKAKRKLFAIRIADSNHISVNSNKIYTNNVAYIENAVFIIRSKSNTLKNNKVIGARLHAIYLTQKSTATITNCTASSVKGAPIYIVGGAKAKTKNCKTQKYKK